MQHLYRGWLRINLAGLSSFSTAELRQEALQSRRSGLSLLLPGKPGKADIAFAVGAVTDAGDRPL